jgi:hypothetical protein
VGVEKVVFRSKSERRNFNKLRRTWGEKYQIYHNLPFLNVFNRQILFDWTDQWNPKPFSLTDREFDLLKKTSIDYTLCETDDRPIICIEFDGYQDGFNVGTDYYSDQLTYGPSPQRQYMMELKLKVAHGSLFPYFVVGSEYFNDISEDIKLTVVDGLIGDILTNKEKSERFAEGIDFDDIGLSQEEWEALDPDNKDFIIEDWALGVELDSEYKNNPLSRIRMSLWQSFEHQSWSDEILLYPEPPDSASVKLRAKYFEEALKIGRRVVIQTLEFGEVSGTAWMSNFRVIGFSGLSLLEDLAFLSAFEKMKRLRALRNK